MIENEYLDVFDGHSEVYDFISEKINDTVYKDIKSGPCKHTNLKVFPTGEGYCRDCGISFTDVSKVKKVDKKCEHNSKYKDTNGLYICRDCGLEIEEYDFDPEWRYYNNSSGGNPSRCHASRVDDRGITKLFETQKIEIPKAIAKQVEEKYNKIVGNNTVRGKGRMAIIAACLFHTYRDFGEYRTTDYIRKLFDLTKKKMSEGIAKYRVIFKDSRIDNTSPEDLIRWILNLTGIDQSHYRKIVHITRYLNSSSILIKRSSPQSVASAVVYFYLCLNPEYKKMLGLSKSKFAEKALLSDITVTKLVKEAANISRCMIDI